MFKTAATLTTGSSKKKEAVSVKIESMEAYAALDYMIKSLTALKSTIEADCKDDMAAHFVEDGCAKKARPVNFKGIGGGKGEASCELRSRSTASGLSEVEASLCEKYSIPTQQKVDVCETFVINPAYCQDMGLLEKVEKALKGVKGLPEDFFMKQEGRSKLVVGDNALDEVFKLDPTVARQLLPVVGTMAIKATFKVEDDAKGLIEAYDVVKDMVDLIPEALKKADEAPKKGRKKAA